MLIPALFAPHMLISWRSQRFWRLLRCGRSGRLSYCDLVPRFDVTFASSTSHTGHVFEVPASYLVPRIIGILGLSGLLTYITPQLTWTQKPATLDPEFIEEAKKIGHVAVSKVQQLLLYFLSRACGG
jgi:hypothetical protein